MVATCFDNECTDLQHKIWLLTLPNDALHMAPISKGPLDVLDLGTGSGIWAVEFAKKNPEATILGLDLSEVSHVEKPQNCKFAVADVETPFESFLGDKKYDFIHSRMLTAGMHDWPRYVGQCFERLKPGGWLELQEVYFPMGCDRNPAPELDESPFLRWGVGIAEAGRKKGQDMTVAPKLEVILHAAGFVDIGEVITNWPVGPWKDTERGKAMGEMHAISVFGVIEGMSLPFLKQHAGWTSEEVERLVAGVREDFDHDLVSKRYWTGMQVFSFINFSRKFSDHGFVEPFTAEKNPNDS